eukprot:6194339-Pleurochrysis_carterae.AAC.1
MDFICAMFCATSASANSAGCTAVAGELLLPPLVPPPLCPAASPQARAALHVAFTSSAAVLSLLRRHGSAHVSGGLLIP